MTTYQCPVCKQTWSVGPTRDMQVCECHKCLRAQRDEFECLLREDNRLRLLNDYRSALHDARDRNDALVQAFAGEENQVSQVLGKAMGYPWFKDDQKNFPGTTEADGVCVGEHVPVTLAMEAADRINGLQQQLDGTRALLDEVTSWYATRMEAIQREVKNYPENIRQDIDSIFALGYIPAR